jgi:hypothetical protein
VTHTQEEGDKGEEGISGRIGKKKRIENLPIQIWKTKRGEGGVKKQRRGGRGRRRRPGPQVLL